MSEVHIAMEASSGDGLTRGLTSTDLPIATPAATGRYLERTWANRFGDILHQICSFPALLGTILAGAVFALEGAFRLDPDVWWHVKTGELILSTHRWASVDPYSYTSAGMPWMSAEWLGDVVLAAVYRLGGVRGLEALLLVLGGIIVLAVYGLATTRSGNCKAAFLVSVPLIPLAGVSFNLRPQMLGYLFLVLTLITMERFRQGKKSMAWGLPLLFLIWVNTHGSWIIGLGTFAVYLVSGLVDFEIGGMKATRWTNGERRRLEMLLLLSLLAIPITPYGTKLAAYPFTVASSLPVSVATVLEWQVMPFDTMGGKIFLVLVLGFFLAQVAYRFSWRLEELLLFAAGTAMACLHARFLLLFVPFFAPLGATILARWAPEYEKVKDQYLLNFALMAAMVVAMVHYFPSQAQMEKKVADQFPVSAVQYLHGHDVPQPLFNSYGFGGYMIEAGDKTFIDGRSELFERTGVLSDYVHITQFKPGAMQVLGRYGIRSCLLRRSEPLSVVLSALPNWQRVYSDDLTALYVKRDVGDPATPAIAGRLSALAR